MITTELPNGCLSLTWAVQFVTTVDASTDGGLVVLGVPLSVAKEGDYQPSVCRSVGRGHKLNGPSQ